MELSLSPCLNPLRASFFIFLSVQILEVPGQMYEPCTSGWVVYDKEIPHTCVWVSQNTEKSLKAAHESCGQLNSSLMMIPTNKKYKFFQELAKTKDKIWISLMSKEGLLFWVTKDGEIPVTTIPDALFRDYTKEFRHYWQPTTVLYYEFGELQKNSRYYHKNIDCHYICEKRTNCKKGWFGLKCDKKFHCHGENYLPVTHLDIVCPYGCQLGWMGKSCSQRKEDAHVTFFCVNSTDQGKYANVIINTKGVNYENIHSVTDEGHVFPWCNNTEIQTDTTSGLTTIKLFVDETQTPVNDRKCAGKITSHNHYQWRIKIQEKEGLLSRNDQEVLVECNFSEADTLSASVKSAIKREKLFGHSDMKRPVLHLDEVKEEVDLQVIDPSTGQSKTESQIGSSVALKIRYGLAEGTQATGVIPYNCDASTPDNDMKVQLSDSNGCPLSGSPVPAFSESNGTKYLVTEPFSLFGFDGIGNSSVEFHCSYRLCFGSQECRARCDLTSNSSSRQRRSTERRVTSSIEVIPRNDNDVTSIIHNN